MRSRRRDVRRDGSGGGRRRDRGEGTAGDGLLGGDDFDEVIIDWVRHDRLVKGDAAIFDDPSTLQLLRASAVQAKHELSAMEQTQIYLPMFAEEEPLPLSRSRFNEMSAELLERLKRPCRDALATASVSADCVDRVLLVGGGTFQRSAR